MISGANCFGKWNNKDDCVTCKCRHSCKREAGKDMIYRFCNTCVMPRFFKENRCIECGQPYSSSGVILDESKKHIKRTQV